MEPERPDPTSEQQAARSFLIRGVTRGGRPFRPSDWADRLCGVMSRFQPRSVGPGAHLQYSPWVQPVLQGEVKCVRVDRRLAELEPMAFRFMLSFAQDNDLQVEEL